MSTYIASYAPVAGSELASAGVVLIPIALLFVLLFTTRVIYAAVAALVVFLVIAGEAYHMPWPMALIAAANGFLYGAWPICLIVCAAIFTFDMCTVTGHFETVKFTIVSLTRDKRLLALLLAYAFSGFIEGASGFSTPIALAAAMMIGVGFTRKEAATAALVGNTIPVVFGGIGIPVATLAQVTRIPASVLAVAAVRLLLPFSLLMPFLVVFTVSSGVRQTLEVWPACVVTGVVNTGMQLLLAQFVGPQPVSILAMIVTLAVLAAFVRVWTPPTLVMTDLMAANEVGMHTEHSMERLTRVGEPSRATAASRGDGGEPEAAASGTEGAKAPVSAPAPAPTAAPAAAPVTVSASSGSADASDAPAAPVAAPATHGSTVPAARHLTRSASLRETQGHSLGVGAEDGTEMGAHEPPAAAGQGRVFIMRRLAPGHGGARGLDSSSIASALYPTTVEHSHGLRHRMAGRVRVTRELTAAGGRELMTAKAAADAGAAVAAAASAAAAAAAAAEGSPPAGAVAVPVRPALASGALDAPPPPPAADAAPPGAQPPHPGGDAHAKEAAGLASEFEVHYDALHPPTRHEVAVAWFPWLLISLLVSIWGAPDIKGSPTAHPPTGLSAATQLIPMTGLDLRVIKPDPRFPGDSAHYHAVEAKWTLDLVAATGICLFLCAALTSAVFRLRPSKTAWILWRSFKRMALSFLTICTLLALGYVIKFSGMDTTLGLAAARTKQGYPFLGPWIGFLGVAITGSATSSNVLFGSLQVVAAQAIGVNPVQMAAANVAGGVLGHIVSTSSMVVAAVATGSDAKSIGPIARGVVGYALALITVFSLWNTLVAYALPGLIPSYDIPE